VIGCWSFETAELSAPKEKTSFCSGAPHWTYDWPMCRNIHTLFNFEPPATEDEVRAASLQYVRKISGFAKPSQANEAAFARAVDEVAEASRRLLDSLVTNAAPKDREVEAARARERAAVRYAAR